MLTSRGEDTPYAIASNSKAFTAAALAMLRFVYEPDKLRFFQGRFEAL